MTAGRSSCRIVAFSVVVLLLGYARSEADPIVIAAGAAEFGAENDTVLLSASVVSLAADPFSGPVSFDAQPGAFLVNYSPSLSPPYDLTLSRLLTIDGVSQTVTQRGALSITPSVDTLTILDSPATAFDFGPRGRLFLTLTGVTQAATVVGAFPFTIAGTLSTAAPTPEPATFCLVVSGVVMVARRLRQMRTGSA
jgi:hypothetical protein